MALRSAVVLGEAFCKGGHRHRGPAWVKGGWQTQKLEPSICNKTPQKPELGNFHRAEAIWPT
jgi:hypothetical protein